MIGMLTSFGVHKNASDIDGDTPLHYAVREDHAMAVQALLAAGAEPSVRNEDLETPLHLAVVVSSSDPKIAQHLLDAGANTNAQDRMGATPLHEGTTLYCEVTTLTLPGHKSLHQWQWLCCFCTTAQGCGHGPKGCLRPHGLAICRGFGTKRLCCGHFLSRRTAPAFLECQAGFVRKVPVQQGHFRAPEAEFAFRPHHWILWWQYTPC